MKYCKVIVVCGALDRSERCRLKYPHHPQKIKTEEDLHQLWHGIVQIEKTVDAGLEYDTVIVCNGAVAHRWWNRYNNTKTKNGKFQVHLRRNDGGSFGGYNFAYQKTDYDGFIFTEEDIYIYGKDYYKRIVEAFNEHDNAGFVALVAVSRHNGYPTHCHGGVGYTTREILKKIEDENGELPFYKGKGWDQRAIILAGEIPFTGKIAEAGYDLFELPWFEYEWNKENLCYPHGLFHRQDWLEIGLECYY